MEITMLKDYSQARKQALAIIEVIDMLPSQYQVALFKTRRMLRRQIEDCDFARRRLKRELDEGAATIATVFAEHKREPAYRDVIKGLQRQLRSGLTPKQRRVFHV
jgi:hypothetical protein